MTATAVILLLLKTSIVLSVFAIGLKATFADATFLLRRPEQLGRAFLSMNVLMPLVALAVGAPFDLHPAVKIALVVIAVSPTPPVFPKQASRQGQAHGGAAFDHSQGVERQLSAARFEYSFRRHDRRFR